MTDLKVKLNIKSLIKYEQLSNKSFYQIDYSDMDNLIELMYCIVISNNDLIITLDEFKELITNTKISKQLSDKFNKELSFINQFKPVENSNEEIINDDNSTEKPIETTYIKDIATVLIINAGLTIEYIMNEISINDIPYLMNAYNEKEKFQLEQNRLWSYMSILPHIDGKKLDSPVKYFPFPWDEKIQQIDSKKELENTLENYNDIMKMGSEMMNKLQEKINL